MEDVEVAGKIKEKMDRGAEVNEEDEEDVSHR